MTREEKIIIGLKVSWFILKRVLIVFAIVGIVVIGLVYQPVLSLLKHTLSGDVDKKSATEGNE